MGQPTEKLARLEADYNLEIKNGFHGTFSEWANDWIESTRRTFLETRGLLYLSLEFSPAPDVERFNTARADFKLAVDVGHFRGQFDDWMKLSTIERAGLSLRPASDPVALTNERHKQHGDWKTQAKLGNKLKATARTGHNWSMLEPYQAEALDMILTKVSRILSGDASVADHWDDIAGYAYLGKGGHEPKAE